MKEERYKNKKYKFLTFVKKIYLPAYVSACVHMCVCMKERDREREITRQTNG